MVGRYLDEGRCRHCNATLVFAVGVERHGTRGGVMVECGGCWRRTHYRLEPPPFVDGAAPWR